MKKLNIDYSEYTPIKNIGNLKNIIGVRNGKVVVTELIGRKNRRTYYKAICDCGNELIVRADYIKESCGCVPCNKGGYFKDLTRKRFGHLTVISRYGQNEKSKENLWKCKCDCGNISIVSCGALNSGNTKSCGHSCVLNKTTKHHKHNTRLYRIYQGMKQRCYNPNSACYNIYGGKGITVCDEWKSNFSDFYSWAMLHGYADNLSIDRIDGNVGYCPENCRWATSIEQQRNLTTNRRYKYNGLNLTLKEWEEITGISRSTLYSRIVTEKWSIEKALTTKVERSRHYD